MLSLSEARRRIIALAEPMEATQVALTEALGLVLAEPVVADVDLPPFDRAAVDGLALRVADARAGAELRLVGRSRIRPGDGYEIGPGRAARVKAGDPLPVGADTVVAERESSSLPGRARRLTIAHAPHEGTHVVRRGDLLTAGTAILAAGTRLTPAMVGLLASQGCTHPVCHRRVRVAVLAVGDDLVGPGDAPVLNRERNAANLALMAPLLRWGATAQDLGAVGLDRMDDALQRAFSARVALVLGPPEGAVSLALAKFGVSLEFEEVALDPGGRLAYGVIRDSSGRVTTHVVHLSTEPLAALAAVLLLVAPLISRLQGDAAQTWPMRRAVWDGTSPPTAARARAVPIRLFLADDTRTFARPMLSRSPADLPGLALADALAVLEPHSGPWAGGELVEVVPMGA